MRILIFFLNINKFRNSVVNQQGHFIVKEVGWQQPVTVNDMKQGTMLKPWINWNH